ncbi:MULTISPECIES: molybdenum cofactor guanylyltransferase [unclassified Paenibacillus]|uniref:molybdenum cofactor guanylyltransferase n=1 Tax=unclassified Paenibacillus TaxID=185978 RepID=UPI0036316330
MLTGVILAGGEDDVGQALCLIDGKPLINRLINEMQSICQEIIVVANEPRLLLPVLPRWVRVITDFIPGFGVLSSMHAAFSLAKYSDLWVTACYMRTVSSSAARLLCERKRLVEYQAALPLIQANPIPFHGVYSQSCVQIITELIHAKEHRISELLKQISWGVVDEALFSGHKIEFQESLNKEGKMNKIT